MQIKFNTKMRHWQILLMLVVLCVSCNDESTVKEATPFDPSKAVIVSDFMPESGGVGTRLVLYGENFGNDVSKVNVVIGGVTAKVVGVKGESLHCIVPSKAYTGEIEVIIQDEEGVELAKGEALEIFTYEKKLIVTTLIGEYVEKASDLVRKDGPFDDCGSFETMRWLTMDPQNSDHLYLTQDMKGTRLIDFGEEYVSTFTTGFDRVSSLNWTLDGDFVVSRDQNDLGRVGNYLFTRESGFTSRNELTAGQGIMSSAIHPVNGELYLTSYRNADVQRYDFNTGEQTQVFPNPHNRSHFLIIIHPSGNYAYLIQTSRHYIMRTDYNWETKIFTMPYLVSGQSGSWGYADGVGSSARLDQPKQGVFVKNPEYEGQADEYDFYFCDTNNHCIRRLTPLGRVETFAGRANNGTWGYNNGDLRMEAKFNGPESIVYDESRSCFYVGDSKNNVIRKIGYEE